MPLIETALEWLRSNAVLAPNMIRIERLVWIVLKIAERRLLSTLTQPLTPEQRTRLDDLLQADSSIRGATRLSWLRQAPGVASPKSIKHLVERLLFLRELALPVPPKTLHQNRVLQLARKCSKYQAQPLLNLPRDRRHALLVTHLFELSQDLTDQALDQFDRLLGELQRKGERRQEKHLRLNSRKMNSHLTVLQHLESADIILLLISPDFMHSDYCYSTEMKRAMERHKQRSAVVIPIHLRATVWDDAPFAKLQALPKDAKPVKGWLDIDETFKNVIEGIRVTIEDLMARGEHSTTSPLSLADERFSDITKAFYERIRSSISKGTGAVIVKVDRNQAGEAYYLLPDKAKILLSGG